MDTDGFIKWLSHTLTELIDGSEPYMLCSIAKSWCFLCVECKFMHLSSIAVTLHTLVSIFGWIILWRDDQTPTLPGTSIHCLNNVYKLLFVSHGPVDFVIVSRTQINHDMLQSHTIELVIYYERLCCPCQRVSLHTACLPSSNTMEEKAAMTLKLHGHMLL